ncbi:MAG: hypothetical protein JSR81_15305 [Proteobacteria bacterium]|nr:hypothetical protein [Pseudomonadota bacterium]
MHIVMPAVFVLAWLGAAAAWAVAAYSTARVWTEGSVAVAERHRARTFKAAIYATTFLVMGFVAGTAGGLFGNLHI